MSGPITRAVEQCKQQQDARTLYELERALQPFLQEMIRLVRRRRKAALQARVDSQAIINAALHSFIKGVGNRQFPQLQNQEDVKRVLTTLVVRTLLNEVAWNQSQIVWSLSAPRLSSTGDHEGCLPPLMPFCGAPFASHTLNSGASMLAEGGVAE